MMALRPTFVVLCAVLLACTAGATYATNDVAPLPTSVGPQQEAPTAVTRRQLANEHEEDDDPDHHYKAAKHQHGYGEPREEDPNSEATGEETNTWRLSL